MRLGRLGVWFGRRPGLAAGLATMSLGGLLLLATGIYYGYGAYARAQLDDLNVTSESVATTAQPTTKYPPVASIYPATEMHPRYWNSPLWAGTEPYAPGGTAVPDGFRLVSSSDAALMAGAATTAHRISIPSIGIDSGVKELDVVDLGDSEAYETPDNIVGHIPETSNPGELGNGWFFGHLESPVQGEGNVFQRLPEVPQRLRDGEDVYVTLQSDDGAYLYQVTGTEVVHQDDLRLSDTDGASITLVACVPRLVYDHRILVSADLVAVKN